MLDFSSIISSPCDTLLFVHPAVSCVQPHLGGDLSAGGAGPVTVHPHPVLGQELLQVHVLQLEQASVAGQGPLPQQGAQEGRLGVGPQGAGARGSTDSTGPPSTDAQRVLIRVQGLVFVWAGRRKNKEFVILNVISSRYQKRLCCVFFF